MDYYLDSFSDEHKEAYSSVQDYPRCDACCSSFRTTDEIAELEFIDFTKSMKHAIYKCPNCDRGEVYIEC